MEGDEDDDDDDDDDENETDQSREFKSKRGLEEGRIA